MGIAADMFELQKGYEAAAACRPQVRGACCSVHSMLAVLSDTLLCYAVLGCQHIWTLPFTSVQPLEQHMHPILS
jgi:hypothetical protein